MPLTRRHQNDGNMRASFVGGLRYKEQATVPGAQTERRGEAGPVRVLLRGWDAPAACIQESVTFIPNSWELIPNSSLFTTSDAPAKTGGSFAGASGLCR